MSETFSDEQWTNILRIARAALDVPKADRPDFIQQSTSDPQIAQGALNLADELEEPEHEEQGRVTTSAGRFELLGYLGSGGAGEVYSARDPELHRIVAVKLLKEHAYSVRDPEQRFLREAQAASALNHPNIITIHEIIRADSRLAIVMEFVPGESLRARCDAPMPEGDLIAIGGQIADGLAAAHAAHVIHRDIKPENLMILPDGHVKILDFGLAQSFAVGNTGNLTLHPGGPIGTPQYMSPEHFRGLRVTTATDVFALGIVFYELAAGQHPFPKGSPLEVLHAITNEEAPPPSHFNPTVTPRIDSLIASMMHKDPNSRPPASEVAAELRRRDTAANHLKDASQTRALRRKRIWIVAAVLATALSLTTWKLLPGSGRFGMEQITTLVPENHATAAAISRSGKFLAYANVDGTLVRTLGTGEIARLNGPPNFTVNQLSWRADDAGLIASGLSNDSGETSIWFLPLAGGAARQLRTGARLGVASPDGSRIAFIADDYSAVWTTASDGGGLRRLVYGPADDSFVMIAWTGDGRHLVVERRTHSGAPGSGYVTFDDHYLRALESISADTGQTADRLPDFFMQAATAGPADELLFLGGPKPGENRMHRLWATSVDAATGRFSRHYRELKTGVNELGVTFDLSATRDGARISLIGQKSRESVFIAELNRSPWRFDNVRELTLDRKASYPHSWSSDSKSVIFESDRSGGYDLFRQSLGERVPEAIVTTPKRWEVLPQLAPDGRFILFAAGPPEGGASHLTLMRIPVTGGSAAEVPGGRPIEEFRCSVGGKGRCVARTSVGRTNFVYSEVDPIGGVGRELARTSWLPSILSDWDISPDGKSVAIPNHDLRSARIRVVTLDGNLTASREREVALPEIANLSEVVWAADQKGWFVSVDSYSSVEKRMYYYSLEDGRLRSLGPIQGWAVPSPDGKKVAYLDRLYDANVWVLAAH